MKVLMLSKEGDGLGVAQKLSREGNDVFVYIEDTSYRMAGEGIVKRIPSWRPFLSKSDLIICDMVGFGKYEELFKKGGKPVFGCNRLMDLAELNRAKGIELFRKFGISVPFTKTYDKPSEAKELLELWDKGYVIKPHNNESTAKTLIVRNKEQFIWALSLYKDTVTVQSIVEGVEVSTEGWFNGRGFIEPFNHTFEEKRLTKTGGPNTGCMGNVVVRARSGSKLVSSTVARLEPFLKKIGYRGPVDINCIVTEDTAYALEFTSRLGYDAVEAVLTGLQEPALDLFFETALGTKKQMALGDDVLIAIRLAKSPWPFAEPDRSEAGMPIVGVSEDSEEFIYFTDCYKEDGQYKYAAGDGVIAKVTAHGRNIKEAQNRAYYMVNSIQFPDKMYRPDIGDRFQRDYDKLSEWGWI